MKKALIVTGLLLYAIVFSGCNGKGSEPEKRDIIIESPSDETDLEEGSRGPTSLSPADSSNGNGQRKYD